MALGKYGPTAFTFRPVDAAVYDTHGNRVTTYSDSTGSTVAHPSVSNSGQVSFWVEEGTYDLLLTEAGGSGTVTQSIAVAAGGVDEPNPNAASSALSSKRLAQVRWENIDLLGVNTHPSTDTDWYVDFTDTVHGTPHIAKGSDYRGSPGTALPLDMTTGLAYPDDAADRSYFVSGFLWVVGTSGDTLVASDFITVQIAGNNKNVSQRRAPVEANFVDFELNLIDQVFSGDSGKALGLRVINLTGKSIGIAYAGVYVNEL